MAISFSNQLIFQEFLIANDTT